MFPFARPKTTGLELFCQVLHTGRWQAKPGLKVGYARPLHEGVLVFFYDPFSPTSCKAPSSPVWLVFVASGSQSKVGERTALGEVFAFFCRR